MWDRWFHLDLILVLDIFVNNRRQLPHAICKQFPRMLGLMRMRHTRWVYSTSVEFTLYLNQIK